MAARPTLQFSPPDTRMRRARHSEHSVESLGRNPYFKPARVQDFLALRYAWGCDINYPATGLAGPALSGYFLGLRSICQQLGIPAAIYADRHSTFQSSAQATIEQELAGEQPKSQFGRLADELGIELIAARSPQAKGRVERLWGTLQDRLVKALRKAGASNEQQANQVLTHFLPKFNQRFRVEPAQSETAYLPWPKQRQFDDFFCFKHTRTISNDNTLPFDGQRLQIPPGTPNTSYAHKRVEVRQHLDGRLEVRYQDRRLAIFDPQATEPLRVKKFSPAPGQTATTPTTQDQPKKLPKKPLGAKPAADHPWRQYKDKRLEKMTDPQKVAE